MTGGTIAGLLDESASARPARPLLRDTAGTTLTVADVAALTTAGTHWLWEAGVRPGMTVAWQLPSHAWAAVLMLSLARADVTQAPVLHLYRRREVCSAVEAAGADILIVDETTAGNAPPGVRVLTLPGDFLDQLRALPGLPHPTLDRSRSADDIRWVYLTSGTTGLPKGVYHSDATLLAAIRGFTGHLGLGDHPDEVGSIAFPIAHIGGIIYLTSAVLADFPVLLVPKVTADELPQLLAEHHVTIAGSSPALYQMLLSAQQEAGISRPLIPSLRMLIGGGAPCPPELHKQVREQMGIPIVHAYGMTEAAMVCVSRAADTDEQQSNSSGLPIPGVTVRISSTSEIEVRGDNLTPGYVDPEQWAGATTPDGWFRTGDRGYLRPDGRIVITGRTKDLIIRKGENIAPDEIENELLAHPLIDEVVVLGQPDRLRGEMVCAVVRRSSRHRDVTLDELCAFLDERGLMKQKWPERLVIVDEFPLTGLGKVAKTELAQRIAGGNR
ncbi:class I adenylate-forming enzyme family protein [Mycolicibacter senuensis]|uniref:class I adenylate-forming enzyme family protein n=1 Tax=Mycolicibacter senuensis TaxID=386913 RepID=UPI000DCE8CE4|nr:class I adenylate-forming enzyme family protein [Mycolicibacter senuensis]RAV02801.1 cyclohex-1-ene-1-carboxylate:CoA ligase [Mycolicibacter senuensis]